MFAMKGVASACFSLMKPDIAYAVKEFLGCRCHCSQASSSPPSNEDISTGRRSSFFGFPAVRRTERQPSSTEMEQQVSPGRDTREAIGSTEFDLPRQNEEDFNFEDEKVGDERVDEEGIEEADER